MAHDHAHNAPPSETAMRVKALETLLTEKGLLDPAAIDTLVETYETKIGPRNGAKVVARRSEERRVGKGCRCRWSGYH